MALTSGTKLGPYEIQSPLGEGGMGEVYAENGLIRQQSGPGFGHDFNEGQFEQLPAFSELIEVTGSSHDPRPRAAGFRCA